MAGFQFHLDTLLAVRRSERDRRRTLMEDGLDQQRILDTERAGVERELCDQQQRTRARAGPGPLDVARLASARRYASQLRAQLAAVAERECALAAEIERRRGALAEADREVRSLEKLREHRHRQFHAIGVRADGKQMDEIASRAANGQSIL